MGNNRSPQRRKYDNFTSPSSSFSAPTRPFAPISSLSPKDLPASPEHPKAFGHSIERMTIHRPEPGVTTDNESEHVALAETTSPSTFQLASDTEALAEQDQPVQTARGTAPLTTSSASALQRVSVSAGDPVSPPPPINRQAGIKRSGWSLERMVITREHLSPVQRKALSASRTSEPSPQPEVFQQEPVESDIPNENTSGLPDQTRVSRTSEEPSSQPKVLQQKPVEPAAPKENMTGLPDNLKTGIESLSGLSLDDVHVHYNSSKPAEVDALAYTQGSEIHVGPGQEKHLAHEAWHVVQQKEGRVEPTLQAKGVAINDDVGLEREADVMGERAVRNGPSVGVPIVMAISALPETMQFQSPVSSTEAGEISPGTRRAIEQIRHAVYGSCFPAGTKLLTKNGHKNIEDVSVGDLVLAHDEHFIGKPTYKRVIKTFQNATDLLLAITVGQQTIRSTPGHVWWVDSKGWTLAQDLKIGDLIVLSDESLQPIIEINSIQVQVWTYNCEVEEYHTYFVAASEHDLGIWVHNTSALRILRPNQIFQSILPTIVVSDRNAIRKVIGDSLNATGNYSTELKGLYSFLRSGGGGGYQGVTKDAINRLEIVLKNVNQKGGGVVAAVDVAAIGGNSVYDLSDPAVMDRLLKAYPRNETMFRRLAGEGVIAVRGKIPALAVRSLVNIPEVLSEADKHAILGVLAQS